MPAYQFGSKGKDVKAIQEALNLYFADVPEYREQLRKQLEWDKVMPAGGPQTLATDEQFGAQTRAAVEAFQRYKHVTGGADGIAGPNTLAALYPCGAFRIGCVLRQGQPQSRPGVPAWGLHMRPPDQRNTPAAPTSGVVVTPQSGPVKIAPTQAPPATVEMHQNTDVGLVPVPKSTLPDATQPGKSNPLTGYLQWKGGLNHTFANLTNPKAYDAIALDWIGIVYNPKRKWLDDWASITMGIDLGASIPLTNYDISQGANPSATVSWAVSFAPQHFLLGRYDFLGRLAEIGVHLSLSSKLGLTLSGSDPTPKYGLAGSSALQLSVDLIKGEPHKPSKLSLFVQCAGSYSDLSVVNGFDFFSVKSLKATSSCSLGISGNVGQ